MVYAVGSPVLIRSGDLYFDSKTNEYSCRLNLKCIGDVVIDSVLVNFLCFNKEGSSCGPVLEFRYPELNLIRDETGGKKTEFKLPYYDVASFEARLADAVLSDGTVLDFSDAEPVYLDPVPTLEEYYEDTNVADQFRVRYGDDCKKIRMDQSDLWFCVCGAVNRQEENACHSCRRPAFALKDIKADSLRAEANTRLRNEAEREDEYAKETRARKRKKRLKLALLMLPVVALAILILAAAPRALAREKAYRSAVSLLNAGNLDAAEEAFSQLETYRDTDEILAQRIPYLRAKTVMRAAREADITKLKLAGLTKSDLNDSNTTSMLLYEAAARSFESLGDYSDCAELAKSCREEIRLEQLRLTQAEYDAACELLATGNYSRAASAFNALGDFSDSAAMITECTYQKALSLFRFIENYEITKIKASVTMVPGETTVFSLPGDEALRLGNKTVDDLQAACGGDLVDVRLEDKAPDNLLPLKDVLTALFMSLGDYKDSAEFLARIEEETDYTREFYMLCQAGDLYGARDWLKAYTGEFPDRAKYEHYFDLYLKYCNSWKLHLGDSTLLPLTIGQSFSCENFSSRVILREDGAVLRLSFGDSGSLTVDLVSSLDETIFVTKDENNTVYMGAITNTGHFGYMHYNMDAILLSSCEYVPSN